MLAYPVAAVEGTGDSAALVEGSGQVAVGRSCGVQIGSGLFGLGGELDVPKSAPMRGPSPGVVGAASLSLSYLSIGSDLIIRRIGEAQGFRVWL